jgi:hypothetical protein
MKAATTILLLCILWSSGKAYSQFNDAAVKEEPYPETIVPHQKKKLNFFIAGKRKKGKLDPASRFNAFRSKIKSLLRPKKFVAIIARDGNQASAKIQYRLKKYNAIIGTLWFDSHGMYKKGYSLFTIGKDEYNYKSVKDSSFANPLRQLAAYANNETKIIIGSCYGGATYNRSSIDDKDTTRMNGDSLMIGVGKIFGKGSIYGSESWVMTKPGLFLKRAAVAGHPGRKLFMDCCYQPAWENIGKWNEYNAVTDKFSAINPVTLDMYGNAAVRTSSYAEKEKVKKEIIKKIGKLEKGLYK